MLSRRVSDAIGLWVPVVTALGTYEVYSVTAGCRPWMRLALRIATLIASGTIYEYLFETTYKRQFEEDDIARLREWNASAIVLAGFACIIDAALSCIFVRWQSRLASQAILQIPVVINGLYVMMSAYIQSADLSVEGTSTVHVFGYVGVIHVASLLVNAPTLAIHATSVFLLQLFGTNVSLVDSVLINLHTLSSVVAVAADYHIFHQWMGPLALTMWMVPLAINGVCLCRELWLRRTCTADE